MRKSFLTFAIGVLTLGLSFGQDQGDARFYGFGSYGLRSNNWGLGGGIEFFFADNFALMPSYTRYNPEVGNQSNLSMDLRYYLSQGPSQVYLMAGYSQTFQNTQPGSPGTKQNFVGANMGVGAFVRLTDWVGILSEFKYQSQYFQESSFKLGLGFPL